jgi:hypothetical protein
MSKFQSRSNSVKKKFYMLRMSKFEILRLPHMQIVTKKGLILNFVKQILSGNTLCAFLIMWQLWEIKLQDLDKKI